MYNEQMEHLISAALADGVLTEKEKQILFKKAESMGIDLDEFEMVLDARLFELKKQESLPSSAPKSNKYGDIRKCSACGAMLQSFQTVCPDCGHEVLNIDANTSITKLFKMLDEVEAQRKEGGLKSVVTGFLAQGFQMGFGDKTTQRKIDIITNFPIPTTKEDILEFLSLAVPNAKKTGNFFNRNDPENVSHNIFVPAWKSKCEQIIMKARFSMKNDHETLAEINEYAKILKIK